MHLAEVVVPIVIVSAVVPGLVAMRITRVWLNAQRFGNTGTGVVLMDTALPSPLKHWITRAFAMRDGDIIAVLSSVIKQKARILEVGCGDCQLLRKLRQAGYDAYGIDIDPGCADAANALYLSDRVRVGDFIQSGANIENLDAILFCDSIRYTWVPHLVLQKAAHLADYILITEPLDLVHISSGPRHAARGTRCGAGAGTVRVTGRPGATGQLGRR